MGMNGNGQMSVDSKGRTDETRRMELNKQN
jgi:hypothetical protein